jgi:DNA-directed RNA polymerase subunit RPC12/RpoP
MNNQRYVEFYRIAQDILGDNLVKPIEDDYEIVSEWVSKEGWLMLPLPSESCMSDAKNRRGPNIYVSASDEEIIIGIAVNTLESVYQLKNILHEFHNKEKSDLLHEITRLEDSFLTKVERKIKEKHFNQSPRYQNEIKIQSNKLDNESINKIFFTVDKIREDGLKLQKARGTSHPIETPRIELTGTSFENDDEIFRQKLISIKPIFETCINIKTRTELNKIDKEKIVVICAKCKEIIPESQYPPGTFCQKCGSLLKRTKMKKIDESYHLRDEN